MMAKAKAAEENSKAFWPNAKLVRGCLAGNEDAWDAFLDKYKNLIYSIPIKYGFSADDAADVFQAVCVEVLAELPKLREPEALPKWLMQVTAHKCFHWKRQQGRFVSNEEEPTKEIEEDKAPQMDELLVEAQQDQILREAVAALPGRCQQLVRLLFFDVAQQPYEEIARRLGLATGSIGFIRRRCLDKLKRSLQEMGFQ